ncbi:translation factor pelota [Coniosporium apollinis CBS 100218]|uniref:Protein DOM34 homolog n=1 Tax=Coniosporium apollinis (strain CBS 100218) TaxID=1168221 RepID=R7Z7E6_CONA1|nr:translation factor pelota [Coniosporium apollinis CBS 100218]EON69861.1 translation factor pelota [Coniosporium apollinis CBS 100218]
MRLIKSQIERRDGSGFATLLPEEPEDMWHAYNLIRPADLLRASAIRRVTTESATGSTSSTRVHTTLTLRVTSVDFDAGASELHVSGKVAEENKYVKLGGFHTLDLELNRNFTLEKAEGWDSVALDIVREATDQRKKAEVWAVVMGTGIGNICLVTENQTILRQRVESMMPKKRYDGSGKLEAAQDKFFSTLLTTLLTHLDLTIQPPKPLLLASSDFTASAFQAYIKRTAINTANKPLQSLLPAIIIAHSSSAHVHALADVLKSPAVLQKLSNTKYARESSLMDRLEELLRKDDGRAWYGPREVERAVEKGAVGRGGGALLISNALFRSQKIEERRRWVGLVDRVKEVEGGEVRVLSSLHESGKRLESLGNVAAILTFPLEDLDEEDEGDGDGGVDGTRVEGEGEDVSDIV